MFRDEAVIQVEAGKGGDGCMSFRREKFVPRGGPDGGDGGRGGHVIVRAVPHLNTLLYVARQARFRAGRGGHGKGKLMTGASGDDTVVEVPAGTVVRDADTGLLMKDLEQVGQEVVAAKGGSGGKGNKRFATATHQSPREFTRGMAGETRRLALELKLIADVGLVGLPNAGKSTLLSRLSKATPKIADYPFTTLAPNLGIVELSDLKTFVMADLPGLIEGAHQGAGLGGTFLRHIERTRLILHLVELAPVEGAPAPEAAYHAVRGELEAYSQALAGKPEIAVPTKRDADPDGTALAALEAALDRPCFPISSVTGQGLDALLSEIGNRLADADEEEQEPRERKKYEPKV